MEDRGSEEWLLITLLHLLGGGDVGLVEQGVRDMLLHVQIPLLITGGQYLWGINIAISTR